MDVTLDCVESVLRAANAEEYINLFKSQNIEQEVLSLLSDDDLTVLGVNKADVRKAILKKTNNLQIRTEKPCDTTVTKEYATIVLSQISHQLHLQHCCLSSIFNRNDILVTNVKTLRLTEHLLNCIKSFETEIHAFQKEVTVAKGLQTKRNKYKKIVLTAATASVALAFAGKILYNYLKAT